MINTPLIASKVRGSSELNEIRLQTLNHREVAIGTEFYRQSSRMQIVYSFGVTDGGGEVEMNYRC